MDLFDCLYNFMQHRLSQLPVENIKPKLPAAPAREVKLFPYDSISIKHFFCKASKNIESGQIQTAAPAFAETGKAAAASAETGKAAAAVISDLSGHVHFPCGHESYD